MKKGYPDFNFETGTPNKKDYQKVRRELTKTMKEFVEFCEENKKKPLEFFKKTTYSELELLRWRVDVMRETLYNTHKESKQMKLKIDGYDKKSLTYIAASRIYFKKIAGTKLEKNKLVTKIKNKMKKKK